MTPLKGVRNSWLILARKTPLLRFAWSATMRASSKAALCSNRAFSSRCWIRLRDTKPQTKITKSNNCPPVSKRICRLLRSKAWVCVSDSPVPRM